MASEVAHPLSRRPHFKTVAKTLATPIAYNRIVIISGNRVSRLRIIAVLRNSPWQATSPVFRRGPTVTRITCHEARVCVALFAAGLAAIAWTTRPAAAQGLYGSLTGSVQDPSGSVIPNATVTIVNDATGQSREGATTDAGAYLFADVLAGTYTVTVTAKGFSASKTTGVEIAINTVTRLNAQLRVGELSDTIAVTANAGAIQTDSADVHVSLGSREVTELPLPGYRNYQTLINLVPGATPASYQNAASGSPGRSLNTNINGSSNTSNNTRLDGALNMRGGLPAQSLYVAPAESIETVNVSTNNFDAQQR